MSMRLNLFLQRFERNLSKSASTEYSSVLKSVPILMKVAAIVVIHVYSKFYLFQIYAVFLFLFSLLFLLWMDYYLFFNSDQVQFIIITFLLSISGSIFCFSCFACCCLIRAKSPNVLSYLVRVKILRIDYKLQSLFSVQYQYWQYSNC